MKAIILVKSITKDMEEWLLERFNMDNTKYYTQLHSVRVIYSKGCANEYIMSSDFRYYGYEVVFRYEEDAVEFRLVFAEDIENVNPPRCDFW